MGITQSRVPSRSNCSTLRGVWCDSRRFLCNNWNPWNSWNHWNGLKNAFDFVGAAGVLHLRAQLFGTGETAVPEQVLAHAVKVVVLHDGFIVTAMLEQDVEAIGEMNGSLRRYYTDAAKDLL